MILAFRRSEYPMDRAVVSPGGLQDDADYVFTDELSGTTERIPAKKPAEKGLVIELPEKRSCKVLFYRIEK